MEKPGCWFWSNHLFFLLFPWPGKYGSTPTLSLGSTAEMGRSGQLGLSKKKVSVFDLSYISETHPMTSTSTLLHMSLPKPLQYLCIS